MGHRETKDGCIVITEAEVNAELKRLGDSAEVLTEIEARRWAMHERGMNIGQIASTEGVCYNNVKDAVRRAEGKLRKVGL